MFFCDCSGENECLGRKAMLLTQWGQLPSWVYKWWIRGVEKKREACPIYGVYGVEKVMML